MTNIIIALEKDRAAAQDFYKSQDYHTQIKKGDLLVAARLNNKIVGLVRLSLEQNVCLLRGMFIDSTMQRTGLGTQMLNHLEPYIESDCYCLPHSWLESFYGQIGFKKIVEKDAPEFLYQRYTEYKKKHSAMIIMKRVN